MRSFVGILLILHGLAHTGPAMWASGPVWLITTLWSVATIAFCLAGLRLLRVALTPFRYRPLVFVGALASLLLFVLFQHPVSLPGMTLDIVFFAISLWWQDLERPPIAVRGAHRRRATLTYVIAAGFVVYLGALIVLRPWYMTWGTTVEDRRVTLFGDSLAPKARYIVNHAVTIDAPVDSVWPWLLQIGQDRAGFYSYSTLENLVGARVTNADTIVPAWQRRNVGDFVRAVPPDWFGGIFGPNLGWRIIAMDSGRAFVLENWGAFVARPMDSSRTRMQIRQRNAGTPSVLGTLVAPAGLLVFEPAHFIMQRGMLLGIKRRAEARRA